MRDLFTGSELLEASREVEAGCAALGLDELAGGVWGDREGRVLDAESRHDVCRGLAEGRQASHGVQRLLIPSASIMAIVPFVINGP